MALEVSSLLDKNNGSEEKALSGLGTKDKKIIPPKSKSEKFANVIVIFLRVIIIINAVIMFFPAFNPARVSGMISKNLSLFTCGVSYDSLIQPFGRAFMRGWVSEPSFKLLFAACLLAVVSAVVMAAGGCMSLGNTKLKRLAVKLSLG